MSQGSDPKQVGLPTSFFLRLLRETCTAISHGVVSGSPRGQRALCPAVPDSLTPSRIRPLIPETSLALNLYASRAERCILFDGKKAEGPVHSLPPTARDH